MLYDLLDMGPPEARRVASLTELADVLVASA